jgi:hypothetical protein
MMRLSLIFCRAGVIGTLAASIVCCAAPALAGQSSPNDWSKNSGHGVIEGKLAVRTTSGGLATKRGADVVLLPYSTQTRIYLQHVAAALNARRPADGVDDPPLDPTLAPFARRQRARDDGSFRFTNLPQGTWIVHGRLSVGFPRIVYVTAPSSVTVDGQTISGNEERRAYVYDYTFAWLDSQPITVRGNDTREAAFQLVARINRTDPHR